MKLKRGYFSVTSCAFGRETSLADGALTIKKEELTKLLLSEGGDAHIRSLELEIVCPGEDARIVHVLDTVQPGVKVEGEGEFMPGHLSDPTIVGSGTTHLFENVAVMECADLPWAGKSALLYARDAIVEMTGPASAYSPFSGTFNLVLRMTMKEGASDVEYDEAVRHAGIRAARCLARLIRDGSPERTESFDFTQPVDPKLPKVLANYEEMKQAFLNIVKNAFEAMAEGGELMIKAYPRSDTDTDWVRIVFSDSGLGIKKEDSKNLFNPFFTTKLRGTGLGLALSKRIIEERHQGRIDVESEEGKGTSVIVELPVGANEGNGV